MSTALSSIANRVAIRRAAYAQLSDAERREVDDFNTRVTQLAAKGDGAGLRALEKPPAVKKMRRMIGEA